MSRTRLVSLQRLLCVGIACGFIAGPQPILKAAEDERTTLHIVVTDAETGKPINQARLTLQFQEPVSKYKFKRSRMVSYSAKTNPEGHYRFTGIPLGTVRLLVTSERHESYGKDIEIEKDNQKIDVKLKKPQPLL